MTSQSERTVNGHFRLQHDACKLPWGATWDYELKVEDMASWYAPLVRLLGLEAEACSGWGAKLGQPCFYHPPFRDCSGKLTGTQPSDVAAGVGSGGKIASWHHKGADTKLARTLSNASLARIITDWVRKDLDRFGYPPWEPQPGRR